MTSYPDDASVEEGYRRLLHDMRMYWVHEAQHIAHAQQAIERMRALSDPYPAGIGLLQVINDTFAYRNHELTTHPVPMDRDAQIRRFTYATPYSSLDLCGVLYDTRSTHPASFPRATGGDQLHHATIPAQYWYQWGV